MKQLIVIILIITISNCAIKSTLNLRIIDSQKVSLLRSPFKTAEGAFGLIEIQEKFRNQYIKELESLIKNNPNDTIILAETYDFVCSGCHAEYVQILVDSLLITYELIVPSKHYRRNTEFLNKDFLDSKGNYYEDLQELKNEIKTNEDWYIHPENYGTDNCDDGAETFYSIIPPSGMIISMYMRCWIPSEYRIKN